MISREKRVNSLEKAIFGRNGSKLVFGTRIDNQEHVKAEGNEISLSEFEKKFPDAILFHIVHMDVLS